MLKKYSKFIIYIFIILSVWIIGFFSVNWNEEDKITACVWESDLYKRYQCEVKNFCKQEDYGKNKTKITNIEKDYEKDMTLEKARELFIKNQDQIFNCWILSTQTKAYKEQLWELIKTTDKSWKLKSKINPKIDQKISLIDWLKWHNNCNDAPEKKSTKNIVIDQSNFELCKYNFFLNYLENKHTSRFDEKTLDWKDFLSNKKVEENIKDFQEKIKKEVDNTLDYVNNSLTSYWQYDDNFQNHVLISEWLKPSFEEYATALYHTLHPINQTFPYKAAYAQNP